MKDEAICAEILGDIASGDAAYKAAQAHGVSMGTFWRWLANDEQLAEKYARAKHIGLERLAEEMLEIADESRIGEKRKTVQIAGYDGDARIDLPAEEVTTGDMVDRSRLQVDTRKWLLSKLAPKKYGEKIQAEITGGIKVLPLDKTDLDLL